MFGDGGVDHVEDLVEQENRVIGASRTHHRGMILQLDAERRGLSLDPRHVELGLGRGCVGGRGKPGDRQRCGGPDLAGESDLVILRAEHAKLGGGAGRQRGLALLDPHAACGAAAAPSAGIGMWDGVDAADLEQGRAPRGLEPGAVDISYVDLGSDHDLEESRDQCAGDRRPGEVRVQAATAISR